MLKNLAFTMLTAVYYSVIPVYCFMQLFSCTDKFKIYIHVLASFFILWALQFIKLYEHASEATTLSQLFIFLNVFFLFRGPVKQKLLSYFIFLLTAILTEILSINIYIQIYNHFFHQPAYTATNIYSLCSFHEKLMIQIMIFSFGYLFYKNIFSLLKKCINYLKFSLLLLITLPIIHPLITTEFTQYYKFQQSFIPVLLYYLLLYNFPVVYTWASFIQKRANCFQPESSQNGVAETADGSVGRNETGICQNTEVESRYRKSSAFSGVSHTHP